MDVDSTELRFGSKGDCDQSVNTPTKEKKFVVPEISAPVDVLEATTFFQVATSGATN